MWNCQHLILPTSNKSVPEIALQNIALDLAKSQANIAQVDLANGNVTANINKAGQINWQAVFSSDKPADITVDEKPSEAADTESVKPAFAVEIANIALKQWKLNAQDHSFTNPLQLNIADVNMNFAVNNPNGDWVVRGLNTKLS